MRVMCCRICICKRSTYFLLTTCMDYEHTTSWYDYIGAFLPRAARSMYVCTYGTYVVPLNVYLSADCYTFFYGELPVFFVRRGVAREFSRYTKQYVYVVRGEGGGGDGEFGESHAKWTTRSV